MQYLHEPVHITICRCCAQPLLPVCLQGWQELQPSDLLAAEGAGERLINFRRQALKVEIVLARLAKDNHIFAAAGKFA